ncbi:hypothetical protein [Zoogloea sp.]|uniref:hypothetical protein n=1 Tax=Zoogloea sp. TaxID=49181 RepID=UPI002612AE4B|nr:hypothetical protein [Zoogloea sp.]MDD3354375.1 hypothetical protein [Zoogloea sp.]
MMPREHEDARQTGRSGRAPNVVKSAHFETSLARARSSGARWLPPVKSCAGQLLLELIEAAVWAEAIGAPLQAGITPRDFDRLARSMREAAYVHRLRQGGWPVVTSLQDATNRFESVRYAAYSLALDGDTERPELAAWLSEARKVRGAA